LRQRLIRDHSKNVVQIRRIKNYNKNTLKDLNALLLQLSSRGYQATPKQLKSTLKNKNAYLICLYDGKKIMGTVTLIVIHQITGYKGYIEDVVVDEEYRRRGFGKKLILHIISLAKKMSIESLELKSENYRVVANILYKKLGFIIKEANVYSMKI